MKILFVRWCGEQTWTPTYLYGGRDRGHSWLATFTFTWEPRQPRRRGARLPAPDDVTSATSLPTPSIYSIALQINKLHICSNL